MNTLDRIADKEGLRRDNLSKISSLQTLIQQRKVVRFQYQQLMDDCPKLGGGHCRTSRQASIQAIDSEMAGYNLAIKNLLDKNKVLNSELEVLRATAAKERENSELQTQLLGEQGLTAESIEIVAESEANAVETQADTQAEIDKNNAETQRKADEVSNNQTLALKDKLKKILPLFLVVVVILIALYIYKTKIK